MLCLTIIIYLSVSCWKHFCALNYILVRKISCCSNKMDQLLKQQKFPRKSSGPCFLADSFLVSRTSPGPPARLTMLHLKQGIPNTSCQCCWLKTANSRVYLRDPQGNATVCYDSLFIATAGVYWTTWLSPTKFHIQTIMTEINSHEHGMHLLVLITFLHFAWKSYFI
jgi:hypothetical protein